MLKFRMSNEPLNLFTKSKLHRSQKVRIAYVIQTLFRIMVEVSFIFAAYRLQLRMHPILVKHARMPATFIHPDMHYNKIWQIFSVPERYVCSHGLPPEGYFEERERLRGDLRVGLGSRKIRSPRAPAAPVAARSPSVRFTRTNLRKRSLRVRKTAVCIPKYL